jgi:2-polyprenyl-3-methyl-5-hydroxy-6-metoxy-1,4-benzoquinol methylase
MEVPVCDICKIDQADVVYTEHDFHRPDLSNIHFVRCRVCGLMYLRPRPELDEMVSHYPDDYEPFQKAIEDEKLGVMRWIRRRKMMQRRKMIERYSIKVPGSILDVGCGTGLFLHEMEQSGWQTAGIEPIHSAAMYAQQRFGLKVFEGTTHDNPYPPGTFDVVSFWDVLEHTSSPSDELSHTADLLRPGGLVAINVPNWNSLDRYLFGPGWVGFDPPRHLYAFNRSTLTQLLHRAGFEILRWVCFFPSYFAFIISLEHWLKMRSIRLGNAARTILHIPGMRFVFEPGFLLANWLKYGSTITVFARHLSRRE